jgi:hypothetical protein
MAATAPDLKAMQGLFWTIITAREGVGPVPDGLFTGDARLSPADRLDIYAGMYFFRLLDCLREDYPRLAAAVGGERFQAMVADYLERHPSASPSLRGLGERLPAFVAGHPLGDEFPYLHDLARLEWARADVFDAPDATPLSRQDLAGLPEDRAGEARLTLIPACALLRFDYNVMPIWRGLSDGEPAKSGKPQAGDGPTGEAMRGREGNSAAPDPSGEDRDHAGCAHHAPPRGPRTVRRRKAAARVWRQHFVIYHRGIDEDEARCLERLAEGDSLGRICQRLAAGRSLTRATQRVGSMLQTWIEDGLLAGFTLPG